MNEINANPTKEFFIEMLTRDIKLSRAIIDLVDNSIDGAKNIRANQKYDGLQVNINLTSSKFIIKDNCGGFSLELAKEYAFRFGRPPGKEFVKHSIGRFGVGMKRALFKIGRHFIVESKHKNDHFIVEVDVDDWLSGQDESDWKFIYLTKDDIPDHKKNLNDDGTIITVTKLYENIQSDFRSNAFKNDLTKELSLALSYSLLKGLKVTVNDKLIERKDITFLESDDIKPLFKKIKVDGVEIKIYAGIGRPSPSNAGWYIFCNDRLVLEADKSYITGWKESREDSDNIIKYHNQYAMFRGAVFFDSEDSKKLPMTTTKTGIDSDHSIFKSTRLEILTSLKQVINYLKKIKDKDERDLIVNNSHEVDITELRKNERNYSDKFIYPTSKSAIKQQRYTTISYSVERVFADRLKDYIGVSSNKEVGEKTFEYFIKMNEIK